jgi:hypothetical protein
MLLQIAQMKVIKILLYILVIMKIRIKIKKHLLIFIYHHYQMQKITKNILDDIFKLYLML